MDARHLQVGAGTDFREFSVPPIAKDGIRLRISPPGNRRAHVIQNIRSRDEQILPAVVVEIENPISPSRHVLGGMKLAGFGHVHEVALVLLQQQRE